MAAMPPQFAKAAKASTDAPAAKGAPPWLKGNTPPKLDPKRKKKARQQAIEDMAAKGDAPATDSKGDSQPPWLKGKK